MMPNMETPCWQWMAGKFRKGYGSFRVGAKKFITQRVSWTLSNGPIPHDGSHNGICVCHKCDNPACVRVDHLFLGTNADNVRDKESKGRGNPPSGEAHGMSRLTESKVREIRALYAAGGISTTKLAARFGASQPNVHKVIQRKIWAHI